MTKKDVVDLSVLSTLPIASWKYPRILLGIPLERTVAHANEVFFQFMQIAAQGVTLLKQDYTGQDKARNHFAVTLLESDFTHLIMLDLDHVHPIDIVQRLASWALRVPGIPVVGGMNFKRSAPYEPCAFFLDEKQGISTLYQWEPGLVKVDALGTGSVMIAREVFEQLEPPWFFNVYDENNWSDVFPGEDMGFAMKCREAGIAQYVDTSITSPHVTDALITESSFRRYMKNNPDKYRQVENGS